MSVITKVNQNIGSLTIGGANTPGKLTIYGGKFEFFDSIDSANPSLEIDGANKKIVIGLNNAVLLDGVNARITSDEVYDATYGLSGVFAKCVKNTASASEIDIPLVPTLGGLMNATLNYTISGQGQYKLLPGFNTANNKPYYFIWMSGGYYYMHVYRNNVMADIANIDYFYITAFFNSNEAINGW